MNENIKEESTSKLKQESMNNSESERFNSPKEKKDLEISTSERNGKEDINEIIEKEQIIEVVEIIEENKEENKEEDDEEQSFEDSNENIEIGKKSINIEVTTAGEVLKELKMEKKDNLNLLKIDLDFFVKMEYKWSVYRTPSETIKFFKKIYKLIKNDETAITLGFVNSLEKLKGLKEQDLIKNVEEIRNELDSMLQSPFFNNNLLLNEFLNIGGSSFSQYNGGVKPFEGWVEKKADPHCMRKVFGYVCKCLECCIFKQYNQRWFVLKDDMITYSDLSVSPGGKHAYFFDEEIKATRSGKYCIKITNLSRILELRFKSYFERELWKQEIEERIKKFKLIVKNNKYKAYTNEKMNNYAYWFVDGKDYFNDLFEKLMGAKKSIFITDLWMSPEVWLRRPILESDYKTFFKKKKPENLSRLMDILEYKAKKGVKIYILIYYECSLALTLDSKYTQDTLEKLHKNIEVIRHPSDKLDLLWSHHEKLVIIDQQIGYVGGLDLCWGRYDFKEHPIYEPPNAEKKYYFPFIDYSNARICDFTNVENYLVESVPRETSLRMPWHDVHTRLIGPVVGDISRHFVERWNYSRFDDRNETSINNVKQNATINELLKSKKTSLKTGGFMDSIIKSVKKQIDTNENYSIKEEKEIATIKEEIEMDYSVNNTKIKNSIINIENINETISVSIDINMNDNMEDEIVVNEAPVFNIQRNSLKGIGNLPNNNINEQDEEKYIEKINGIEINNEINNNNNKNENEKVQKKSRLFSWKTFVHKEKEKDNGKEISKSIKFEEKDFDNVKKQWMANFKEIDEDHFLVPRKLESMIVSEEVINNNNQPSLQRKGTNGLYSQFVNKIKKNKNNLLKDLFQANNEIETIINDKYVIKGSTPSHVQVLRSVGEWSLGLKTKENSILEAYYHLIENSKHYIYIENQFFISKSFEDNGKPYLVENKIALYIRNRILKACRNKEKFRVYIFIPLLPGFAGEPEKSGTLQIILKYTYEGICRNNGLSIIEKLIEEMEKIGEKWEDYIGFYSLRNHDVVNGIPKTEIIYIHSKLMIIDDTYVICGSANINDRSMKGSRDSEFAVLIKEKRVEMSRMNKKKFKASKFASSLRKALMAEHLGINPNDEILIDPVSNELHELIRTTAHNNTFAYRLIFGCYPDDCYTKFNMIKNNYDLLNKAQEDNLKKIYEQNKKNIIGHIVEFPLHFLEEEELGISFFSKENLVPERNFT